MGDVLEYPEVGQEVRGHMNPGRLKLQSTSVIFKNLKTGKIEQFQGSDVAKCQWIIRARGHCLKITLNGGNIYRYDGFKESEFERLAPFLAKNYSATLEKVDLSVKGWNWGSARFKGNALEFEVGNNHIAFEIPLGNVSHTTMNKNEVTLEFHQNDDAAVSLMEARFHVPGDSTLEEENPVSAFHENVLVKADIVQITGNAMATFEEVQCLTPRGRYDIKVFPSFMQLHGKTFDYKVPYATILRLFLLPHRDMRQMFFVVSVDPPIKQGQTRYHFLILLFNKEDETTLELALSEEEIQEKYEGRLQREMTGPEYEIISRIMKTLVNRKITVPGSFLGNTGTHSISCSYKATTGFLYPLERGFIFVHKPPLHIRFDEVSSVNFSRNSGNTRSFDFEVSTKSGTEYVFSSIEKDEYGKLYDFVSQKKLRVKNIGNKEGEVSYVDDMMDSDDEANVPDAYLNQMKREGREKLMDDLDDEDDSTDESFVAPEDSESEVAEEYDTDAESSSSSDESESGSQASGAEPESKEDKEKRLAKKEADKEKKRKEKARKPKTKTIKEPGMGKRKKNKKGPTDPDKPKRPQSAYFLWMNENRERIKSENPGIAVTEIGKLSGEQWRKLDDKTEWDEKAKEAKAGYEVAMEEYKAKVADRTPPSSPEAKKKKTKSKSPKKKPPVESKAGSGSGFKSKEYISSSESSASDSDEKPLKKKPKTKKKEKEKKKEEASSSSDEDKPLKPRKSKRGKETAGSDSEPASLPSDHSEEIMSVSPAHSGSDDKSASDSD